ncbi:hypothetical protein LTR84_010753 [Exophiala bonariae]|uniref:Nitronate monooxygenase domain-containing protein n=1 Tax=Exophiala bonariae TaxID=1690606 RepID=A0AAV9MSI3_9EURO|nr:hypothetical protein LTR84_010753 [Exophiala bonariae]
MHYVTTATTRLLGIQHPIMLAGMGQTSGAELVAAVSNAGGIGVIGGVNYTPKMLREMIMELKTNLRDPNLPFGVDLLIPQVGGSARKTNIDYTKGALFELVDIMIETGTKLFVSAVGIPPKAVVDKLHAAEYGRPSQGIVGAEAGGHTGDIPTSILIPACADICKQYVSPLTGLPVQLVAAGGIYDGRGVASAMMLGASAVWIGTRFLAARESGAPEAAKKSVIESGFDSTIRSTFWSGRPLRALATPYVLDWEKNRQPEFLELQSQGKVVMEHELDKLAHEGKLTEEIEEQSVLRPMGLVAALVTKSNQSAGEIVDEIMGEAYEILTGASVLVSSTPKL